MGFRANATVYGFLILGGMLADLAPREKAHEKSARVVRCPGRCAGCTSR